MLKASFLASVVSFLFLSVECAMEVNKKQLADIFGASIRTIQNWQEQGMPVLRGGGKGNEVLYDSAAVIKWYAERDAEIENEKLRREVEELLQASETDLQPGTIEYERHRLTRAQADAQELKMPETPLKWWKPHSVLSCCRGSQVKLPVFSTGSPVGAAAFSGTGKPTC